MTPTVPNVYLIGSKQQPTKSVLHIASQSATITAQTGDPKNCTDFRYLGCKIANTEASFQNRRQLAWFAARKLSVVFHCDASDSAKIKLFRACVESVLFYSAESWVLTQTLSNKVNASHRALRRFALGIHFPHTLTNDGLYRRSGGVPPATKTIQRNRLRLIGHALRHPDVPLARVLRNPPTEPYRQGGALRLTYWDQMQQDLNSIGVAPHEIMAMAGDRERWSTLIHG